MLVPWLVFPLVLGLLAAGSGLLVQAVAGLRLPGPLVLPVGLAAIIVVGEFTTISDATAELTTPAIVAVAVCGGIASLPWRGGRIDGWALAVPMAVFAVFAAPIVLSGEPTFGGFIKLDDTATWFALTDRVMEHGHSVAGLPPSTYEATLRFNLAGGYPIGVFIPFGAGAKLVGQDVSLVFQPYLAFLAAMLALSLYTLAGRLIASRSLRALTAFVGAQAALLYGYSLWGGVKEVATAALLALAAALCGPVLRAGARGRATVPLAVAAAATLGVLSLGGGIAWLGPMLALALGLAIGREGLRAAGRRAAAFLGVSAVISVPWLLATSFLPPTSAPLTSGTALGNLLHPLSPLQIAGVWPTGDFRATPSSLALTDVLVAVVAAAALVAVVWALRRRAWEPLVYIVGTLIACAAIAILGSAWVTGKALASASPALPFAAVCLAGLAFEGGARLLAGVVAALIVAGVVWSNALAYHDVWLAPRDQLAELQRIGPMIAGRGPTLMTEYEPYGARHFLRDAAPEGDSELRRRLDPLRGGGTVPKASYADIDRLQLDAVLAYRTLVLRRSPVASRPPSPYRLAWSGRYYQVWERSPGAATPLAHLSLGDRLDPGGKPSCAAVHRLARLPGTARLAYAARPAPVVSGLARDRRPSGWLPAASGGAILPSSSGTVTAPVRAPRAGRYGFWLGGSFRGEAEIAVDGREVGSLRDQLDNAGGYVELGAARLAAGPHRVTVRYRTGGLDPGSGGPPFAIGPLVLSRGPVAAPVHFIRPAGAASLCGRPLDWIEALPG